MPSSTYIRTRVRRIESLDSDDRAHLNRMMKAFGCGTSFFIQALLTKELRDTLGRRYENGAPHKYYLRDRLVSILGVKEEKNEKKTNRQKTPREFDVECRRLKANGEIQLAKVAKRLYRGIGKRLKPEQTKDGSPVMKDILQGRMWKLCLEEAIQIVETYWATLTGAVKKRIMNKKGWDEDQKHYACWLMTPKQSQFFNLLSKPINDRSLDPIALKIPSFAKVTKVNGKQVSVFRNIKDREQVASAVKHLLADVRKKGRIKPPSAAPKCNRVLFDCSCWKLLSTEENRQIISVMGMVPAKKRRSQSRIRLNVKGVNILRGTLEVMRVDDEYLINVCETVETKTAPEDGERVAIDLGLTEVFVDSDAHFYGEGLGELIADQVEKRTAKGRQRGSRHALKKRYSQSKNTKLRKKALNIQKHNLGRKKQKKERTKFKARIASKVNHACNELFRVHSNCKELVLENLSHAMTPRFSKKMNRRLSGWIRGYIVERITYHAAKRGIEIITVNAAYTSRVCPVCGSFAKENRTGDLFHCSNCGATAHADILAAENLLDRSYDTEITVAMRKEQVAKILDGRFVAG